MPEPSLRELLSSSGLAFTGTVEAVGATTMADVPVDDRTVIVRVGELLHGPGGMSVPPGSRVTVQLATDLPPMTTGEQATFFANGLLYGDSLVVGEVGRTSTEEATAPTERLSGLQEPVPPVQAALAELAQDEVVGHARGADAVVRGQVTALSEVPRTGPPREHDPHYWIATLAVDVVAKGELPGVTDQGGTTSVLYANSIDVRWFEAPKPKAGQGGLWLLHAAAGDQATLAPFELLHPIDLQPSMQLNLLRERGI